MDNAAIGLARSRGVNYLTMANAYKAAKESTGWRLKKHRNNHSVEEDTNRTAPVVFIPPLKAAIKAVHRQQIDSKWAESWAAESKGKELRALAPTPGTKVLQLHKGIKKPETALITQMRTGKIGLTYVPFYLAVSWQITASASAGTGPRQCGMFCRIVANLLG